MKHTDPPNERRLVFKDGKYVEDTRAADSAPNPDYVTCEPEAVWFPNFQKPGIPSDPTKGIPEP